MEWLRLKKICIKDGYKIRSSFGYINCKLFFYIKHKEVT